jgi:hypothetical protein
MNTKKSWRPTYDILKFERTSFFLWFKWNSDYYVVRKIECDLEYYLGDDSVFYRTIKYCKKFRCLESAKNKLHSFTTQYSTVAYSPPDEVFLDPLEAKFEELENSVPKNVPKLVNGNLKWSMND